jgi:uncharacterized protein YndB with AHSA1/START domain
MEQDLPEVHRSVELDADLTAVWDAVADPERRAGWLDDDEAAARQVRVESVDDGHALAWTWWHPDDPASASRVEIVLTELASGGTRVAVTERLVGTTGTITARASATATAGSLWVYRLLGLELVLFTARALVG